MFKLFLLIIFFLLLLGCAAPPVQEMSDARQALHAAKAEGVAVDNRLLVVAEHHLKSAELKLQRRWYESARRDAVLARDAALKARELTLIAE